MIVKLDESDIDGSTWGHSGYRNLAASVIVQSIRDVQGLDDCSESRRLDALIWMCNSESCELFLQALNLPGDAPLRWIAKGSKGRYARSKRG